MSVHSNSQSSSSVCSNPQSDKSNPQSSTTISSKSATEKEPSKILNVKQPDKRLKQKSVEENPNLKAWRERPDQKTQNKSPNFRNRLKSNQSDERKIRSGAKLSRGKSAEDINGTNPKQRTAGSTSKPGGEGFLKALQKRSLDEIHMFAARRKASDDNVALPMHNKSANVAKNALISPKVKEERENKPSPDPPKAREKMKKNDVVRSENNGWVVLDLLGSGGFGDVYKVRSVENGGQSKEYAMKTEMVEGHRSQLRLKIEVTVLKLIWQQEDRARVRHFVEFVDRGKTEKFKFLVMGLVGPSLEDLRKKARKNFSKGTALNIAFQTMTAISSLHGVGWIHRDIKPANFAIGIGEREETIFMLDFGIACSVFVPGTRKVKIPRERLRFLGTVRFAPRACHQRKDQERKDDMESWLFMVYDLIDAEYGINWKGLPKDVVAELKDVFFRNPNTSCHRIVPSGFLNIVNYIDSLTYGTTPNYGFIESMLLEIAKKNNIDWQQLPDWVSNQTSECDSITYLGGLTDNKQLETDGDTSDRKIGKGSDMATDCSKADRHCSEKIKNEGLKSAGPKPASAPKKKQ